MSEQQWARPFRITQPNGEVLDGVQFPSGHCYVDQWTGPDNAFDEITVLTRDGSTVEWADGGQA